MYNDFRTLAFEDQTRRMDETGMSILLRYYHEALISDNVIRERVARHYVDVVKAEDPTSERPAFKQLRTAWRNGALNMKNRKKITDVINTDLKASLER